MTSTELRNNSWTKSKSIDQKYLQIYNTEAKLTFDAEFYGYHEWKVVQLNIQMSQSSVATDMRWGGSVCFHLFRVPQFITKCKIDRIVEIGPHLPKLS